MNKIYLIIATLATCFAACTEKETPVYNGKSYIYFSNNYESDSTTLSFFFHPGQDKYPVDLELTLGGELASEDIPLKLGTDTKLSTATPEDYFLPENPVFRANHEKDTIRVWINKSAKLDNQFVSLYVSIENSDTYTAGPRSQRLAKIVFTSQKSQPAWWDDNIRKVYLGKYSHAKYEEFMKATGVSDLTGMERDEIYELSLKFKYYLIERANSPEGPVMDGDQAMTVPVIG